MKNLRLFNQKNINRVKLRLALKYMLNTYKTQECKKIIGHE